MLKAKYYQWGNNITDLDIIYHDLPENRYREEVYVPWAKHRREFLINFDKTLVSSRVLSDGYLHMYLAKEKGKGPLCLLPNPDQESSPRAQEARTLTLLHRKTDSSRKWSIPHTKYAKYV